MEALNIPVFINKKEIEKVVRELIIETGRNELLFMDIEEMSRLTSMNSKYLKKFVLNDPRIMRWQRSKSNRKRYWLYEPTRKALLEIVSEWDI